MRLERLQVSSYGVLAPGLEMEFGAGLNVLYAPNESGKSTLAELITALFYGFGKRKAGVHPYEPWLGDTQPGGELAYSLDDGRGFILRRHLQGRGELLDLSDLQGREVDLDRSQPGELHLGCGRGVFMTVARIGLDELGEAFSGAKGKERAESESQLLGFFYQEAATLGQAANPVEVVAKWEGERKVLFSPDKRSGKQDQELVGAIDQARSDLSQAREREAQARAASDELHKTSEQAASLAKQREELQLGLRRARQSLHQAQAAERLAQLESQIQALAEQGLVDEKLHGRAHDLARELGATAQRAAAAKAEAEQAAKKLASLTAGRDLAEMQGRLDRLNRRWVELRAAGDELDRRSRSLGAERRLLQGQWQCTPEQLASLDPDTPFHLERLRREMPALSGQQAEIEAAMAGGPTSTEARLELIDGLAMLASAAGLFLWAALTMVGWPPYLLGSLLAGSGALVTGKWLARLLGKSKHLRGRLQEVRQELQELEGQWAELTKVLPEKMSTAQPRALATSRSLAVALMDIQVRLARDQTEAEERLASLAGDCREWGLDLELEMGRAFELARACCGDAEAAKRLAAERAGLAGREGERAGALEAEQADLLRAHGLADVKALDQARERARKVDGLKAKADEARSSVGDGKRPAPSVEQAQVALGQAENRLGELDARLRGLEGRRGELRSQVEHLLASGSAAAAVAELERLEQQRADLALKHDTALLAGELLNRAMDHYRLEAQPSLLRRAAGYLEQATFGAYTWLGADLFKAGRNKKPDLSARQGSGEVDRQAEVLSRGTRDQLYLCLRLALADEVSEGRETLPLILDDPLVNFDDERMGGALAMLAELAARRQVILLTCHQGLADRAMGLSCAVGLGL